ncbi:hypothetical protein [Bartonella apis]|uniref:hypothetical protein n=1 Tax=Bartonella apis TaxID=1686310 RepID=UPI003C6C069C
MDIGCNRLENAVKPQRELGEQIKAVGCNRLENAVKPQHERHDLNNYVGCNRLGNAVKPQQKLVVGLNPPGYISL